MSQDRLHEHSSYVPERLIQVEFWASRNWVCIRSITYVRGLEL